MSSLASIEIIYVRVSCICALEFLVCVPYIMLLIMFSIDPLEKRSSAVFLGSCLVECLPRSVLKAMMVVHF